MRNFRGGVEGASTEIKPRPILCLIFFGDGIGAGRGTVYVAALGRPPGDSISSALIDDELLMRVQ